MSTTEPASGPADDAASPKPSGMPRVLVLLLGIAALFVAAQGLQGIRSIVAGAFLALNLVIVVWPIQAILAKRIPRALASLVAGLVAFGVLAALIWSIGWTIARLIQELPKYNAQWSGLVNDLYNLAAEYDLTNNAVVQNMLTEVSRTGISTVVSFLQTIISGMTSVVGLVVIVVIMLIFMIFDSGGFSERMERVGQLHNAPVAWALSSFARGTRRYWVVTTVVGLTVAAFNWVYLLALGVPLALIWALFTFVTNYIPYIGFVMSLIPPMLMAFLANSPWTALWVFVGFYVFNTLVMTFIQPRLAGNAVGITPTVAFLSLLLWAYILGPMGTILAIPATSLAKALLIDIDPNTRWLNAFIASNPKTSDQDPMRLSDLLARAKRIRTLSAKAGKPGVSSEEMEAVSRELATLAEEDDEDGPHDHPVDPAPRPPDATGSQPTL